MATRWLIYILFAHNQYIIVCAKNQPHTKHNTIKQLIEWAKEWRIWELEQFGLVLKCQECGSAEMSLMLWTYRDTGLPTMYVITFLVHTFFADLFFLFLDSILPRDFWVCWIWRNGQKIWRLLLLQWIPKGKDIQGQTVSCPRCPISQEVHEVQYIHTITITTTCTFIPFTHTKVILKSLSLSLSFFMCCDDWWLTSKNKRYNNYTKDPLTRHCASNSIAARYDLCVPIKPSLPDDIQCNPGNSIFFQIIIW